MIVCALAAALWGCGGDGGTSPTPDPTPPPSGSCAAGAPVSGIPTLRVRLVASGFSFPLDLQSVAGDAERLYVVEQGGRIRIIRNGIRFHRRPNCPLGLCFSEGVFVHASDRAALVLRLFG